MTLTSGICGNPIKSKHHVELWKSLSFHSFNYWPMQCWQFCKFVVKIFFILRITIARIQTFHYNRFQPEYFTKPDWAIFLAFILTRIMLCKSFYLFLSRFLSICCLQTHSLYLSFLHDNMNFFLSFFRIKKNLVYIYDFYVWYSGSRCKVWDRAKVSGIFFQHQYLFIIN